MRSRLPEGRFIAGKPEPRPTGCVAIALAFAVINLHHGLQGLQFKDSTAVLSAKGFPIVDLATSARGGLCLLLVPYNKA